MAPDSSGAVLSLDTPHKSRRETPLRFLPVPDPAWLPAPARRLRGRRRAAGSVLSRYYLGLEILTVSRREPAATKLRQGS